MSGLLVDILCITRRGFQLRSYDSPTPSTSYSSATTNYEHHHSSDSSLTVDEGCITSRGYKVEKLGEKAREAKERLDQKLRRTKSKEERDKDIENGKVKSSSAKKNSELFGLKKNGIKTFSRVKQWNDSSEKDVCTICLDTFTVGDNLLHLQCDHKFHSWCLVPWLENYAYCPCCRMGIVS